MGRVESNCIIVMSICIRFGVIVGWLVGLWAGVNSRVFTSVPEA